MRSVKKNMWNLLFLFLVFGLTVYGVFRGEDLTKLIAIMKRAHGIWLFCGVLCVVFFIWGESIIIYYLMGTLSVKLKKWTCFLFSSVGFFFSCITPSASGGQPMQIYYMRKKNIPIPVSTLVLMIVTITYKLVLVVIGVFVLLFGRGFIQKYLMGIRPVFYLGIALNVFCVSFMLLLVFHPVLAKTIMIRGMHILEKMHVLKQKETRLHQLKNSMELYGDTAVFFKSHIRVIGNVFAITFLQRTALFFTTYFVYLAFGLHGKSVVDIVLLQAIISVSVDMLPLPGGMGISEKLFLMIFVPIFGVDILLPAMLLSRGLGYYTQLLLSAVMTIVAQFTIRTEKEKEFVS